jgi:hypothetical protein
MNELAEQAAPGSSWRDRDARSRAVSGVPADSPPPPLSTGRKVTLTCGNADHMVVITPRWIASFRGLPRPDRCLDPDGYVRFGSPGLTTRKARWDSPNLPPRRCCDEGRLESLCCVGTRGGQAPRDLPGRQSDRLDPSLLRSRTRPVVRRRSPRPSPLVTHPHSGLRPTGTWS